MAKIKSIYPWDPMRATASQLIDLMRRHRQDGIEVQFFYGDYVHELGVMQKNGTAAFYLDEEFYASAFSFAVTAAIEDMLFADIAEPVFVMAINGADPASVLELQ